MEVNGLDHTEPRCRLRKEVEDRPMVMTTLLYSSQWLNSQLLELLGYNSRVIMRTVGLLPKLISDRVADPGAPGSEAPERTMVERKG